MPTYEQVRSCAEAFGDAIARTLERGTRHSVAYDESEGRFVAYEVAEEMAGDDLPLCITRSEAEAAARAYGLDPDASTFSLAELARAAYRDELTQTQAESLAAVILSGDW